MPGGEFTPRPIDALLRGRRLHLLESLFRRPQLLLEVLNPLAEEARLIGRGGSPGSAPVIRTRESLRVGGKASPPKTPSAAPCTASSAAPWDSSSPSPVYGTGPGHPFHRGTPAESASGPRAPARRSGSIASWHCTHLLSCFVALCNETCYFGYCMNFASALAITRWPWTSIAVIRYRGGVIDNSHART